jgi:hypothetical protein
MHTKRIQGVDFRHKQPTHNQEAKYTQLPHP